MNMPLRTSLRACETHCLLAGEEGAAFRPAAIPSAPTPTLILANIEMIVQRYGLEGKIAHRGATALFTAFGYKDLPK